MGVAKGHARDRHLLRDGDLHHKSADQCVLGIGHLRMHLVLDDAVALAVPNTPSPTSQTILFSRVRPRVRAPASGWLTPSGSALTRNAEEDFSFLSPLSP